MGREWRRTAKLGTFFNAYVYQEPTDLNSVNFKNSNQTVTSGTSNTRVPFKSTSQEVHLRKKIKTVI